MPKQLVWVKLKSSDGGPPPRLGHSLVEMDKDTFILYGGLENNTKGDQQLLPSDKVYNLKITVKGDCVWTAIDCEGEEIPLPRTNHSACKISKNEMFVFGGYYTSKKRFNDVHILVTGSGKIFSFSSGKPPPKRMVSPFGLGDGFVGFIFPTDFNFRKEIQVGATTEPEVSQG